MVLSRHPREQRPGKWSLLLGTDKISLQDAMSAPDIARASVPGSGNFCILIDEPVENFANEFRGLGIGILAGPKERDGAMGRLRCAYFRDADGHLVEISHRF